MIKPGITGLAQVSGGINLDWPQRWVLDIDYNKIGGHSSAGRAPAWHAGGQGFKSPWLH